MTSGMVWYWSTFQSYNAVLVDEFPRTNQMVNSEIAFSKVAASRRSHLLGGELLRVHDAHWLAYVPHWRPEGALIMEGGVYK